MTTIDASHPETIHVFAVDGTRDEAEALARTPEALGRALGGVEVAPDRAEAIDPAALADLGLSTYLAEGLGAAVGPVRADAARLDRERRPVVILRPRAVAAPMRPEPPLAHLGSYALERAAPAEGKLTSAAAEGNTSAAPPPDTRVRARADRRASGVVAMVALAAALLVVVVVWLVAAA